MSELESLAAELKKLIIEALVLEDVSSDEIEADAPLFVDGLGLDSIDALELAMVFEDRYGIRLGEDPDENRAIFESVRTLTEYIAENRTR